MEVEGGGEEDRRVGSAAVRGEERPGSAESRAGDEERREARPPDERQIVIEFRFREGRHKEGAGGHGRPPVSEEGAGEHRPADIKGGHAHAVRQGGADDAHGGGSAEGGAREEGNGRAEEEGGEHHPLRPAEGHRQADDGRNGAAGAPQGGDDADEEKNEKYAPHGLHAVPRHEEHIPRGVPPQAAGEEENESQEQRPEDRQPRCQAGGEGRREEGEHSRFHDSLLCTNAAPLYPPRRRRAKGTPSFPAGRRSPDESAGVFIFFSFFYRGCFFLLNHYF